MCRDVYGTVHYKGALKSLPLGLRGGSHLVMCSTSVVIYDSCRELLMLVVIVYLWYVLLGIGQ